LRPNIFPPTIISSRSGNVTAVPAHETIPPISCLCYNSARQLNDVCENNYEILSPFIKQQELRSLYEPVICRPFASRFPYCHTSSIRTSPRTSHYWFLFVGDM